MRSQWSCAACIWSRRIHGRRPTNRCPTNCAAVPLAAVSSVFRPQCAWPPPPARPAPGSSWCSNPFAADICLGNRCSSCLPRSEQLFACRVACVCVCVCVRAGRTTVDLRRFLLCGRSVVIRFCVLCHLFRATNVGSVRLLLFCQRLMAVWCYVAAFLRMCFVCWQERSAMLFSVQGSETPCVFHRNYVAFLGRFVVAFAQFWHGR